MTFVTDCRARRGCSCSQAVGLQGLVATAAHMPTRTPEVCGHGLGSRRIHGFVQKMSPAGIIGGNGLYVRVVGIGVVLRGENTKNSEYDRNLHLQKSRIQHILSTLFWIPNRNPDFAQLHAR